jgi:hypothetical protein
MNKVFALLFCLIIATATWAQSTEDEKAIMQLLIAETDDFTKLSIAELAKKHWILDDKTTMMVTLYDGTHLFLKTSEILEYTQAPPEGHAIATKSDWKFSVTGNVAFVTFAQQAATKEGDKIYSHELRMVEKVNGVWKIHASSVHQYVPRGQE